MTGRKRKTLKEHSLTMINRIESSSSGCWNWTGPKDKDGYGQWTALGQQRAHRVAWTLCNGEIPGGMFVCHKCDNPSCINPNHLFLGNHIDNVRDMHSKRRAIGNTGKFKTHCKNGHEYSVVGKYGKGCAECGRKAGIKYYHKRKREHD